MPELELAEVVRATGGSLLRGRRGTVVRSYDIDTRRVEPGGVFFALAGEHTDGHRFLGEALRRGAAAAVIERVPPADEPAPPALIHVEDAVAALTRCAGLARRKLSGTKWIGLTGSNGKTTTKEMIAEGLAGERRVHRTPGNFNNHLGVPLSLLACPDDAECAVIELAMSASGEVAELARLTDPHIGLLTNVRAAHLESFNSLDDIAAAKGELFALLRDDAVSVVNLDDVHVRVQAARHVGPRVTFGRHAEADLRLEEVQNRFEPGATLTYHYGGRSRRLQLRIGGAHSAFNALAALATIVAAGGDVDAAGVRLERLEPGPGRGRKHRLGRGILLVDDSYNSSPAALASVLETLRLTEPPGRRVLVMGDMLELGRVEGALHRAAGQRAAAARIGLLCTVGALTRGTAETARRSGVPEVHHYDDAETAAEALPGLLGDGDLVLVKGSRKIGLERVVQALTSRMREAC